MKYYIKYFNKIFVIFFNKNSLHLAIEKENIKIIMLLLSQPQTDVNVKSVLFHKYL